MQEGITARLRDLSFVSLLGVLVAGILVDVTLSPGTIFTDIPDLAFPLGILSGFLMFAYLLRLHGEDERLEKRVGQFGWLGAIVGGTIGIWLATRRVSLGLPISGVHDVALTALDIGIVAGALAGLTSVTAHRDTSTQDDERGRVLAESTWTNRPEPDPILVEIVEQLAELEGVDPLELEPVSVHFNLDVFSDIRDGGDQPWQVLFYTDEYEIRVNSQGTVTVYDAQGADEDVARWSSVHTIQ